MVLPSGWEAECGMVENVDLRISDLYIPMNFSGGSLVKNSLASAGDAGSILCQEGPLEKEMATHSSILRAWEIPWSVEPGRL